MNTVPHFDEFCVATGTTHVSTRDRSRCTTCPLGALCDLGFAEQARRVIEGQNPDITVGPVPEGVVLTAVLSSLTHSERAFVETHIPGLEDGKVDVVHHPAVVNVVTKLSLRQAYAA